MHYLPQAPGMHVAVHPGKKISYTKKINKTNKWNKKHLMKPAKRRKGLFRGSQFKTCLPRSIPLPELWFLTVYYSYLIFPARALSLLWPLQLPSTSQCSIYSALTSIQTFNCSLLANGVCFMLSTASLLSARYTLIEIIFNYFSEENVTWKTIISTAEQPLPLACPVHLQCLSIQNYVLSHFSR